MLTNGIRQAMSRHLIQCPRPYLFDGFRRVNASRAFSQAPRFRQTEKSRDVTHDYEKRVAQLQAQRPLEECYPRLSSRDETPLLDRKLYSAAHVHTVANELQNGEVISHHGSTTLTGMLCYKLKPAVLVADRVRQGEVSTDSGLQACLRGHPM